MKIIELSYEDVLWDKAIQYVENCGWKSGISLGEKMRNHYFHDFERVIIVLKNDRIIGYCTFSKKDSVDDIEYSPFIGYIFVDNQYRGKRISEMLIQYCIDYAKKLGFQYVYVISDHVGLYEKYYFTAIQKVKDNKGREETLFRRGI